MKVSYIYAKLFKKLRGVAFLNSLNTLLQS